MCKKPPNVKAGPPAGPRTSVVPSGRRKEADKGPCGSKQVRVGIKKRGDLGLRWADKGQL